ncbi:hypothetical protein [Halobaculum sp. D14]|uniref:hypothetical protein n=1 Tax=unclassified Halobaculum TaxID=2640896 RepID=UPI003EB9DE73
MTVGPESWYGLFFLAASAVVVLLALSTHVLGRMVGHERALPAVLGLVGGFTLVGALGGLPASAATHPLLLGFAFLYVPVGVGAVVAKGVTARRWRAVCRLLLGGWMAALVFALVTQAAGASLDVVIGWTPALFGVDWYVGFLGYMTLLGVVAGAATVGLLRRTDGSSPPPVSAGQLDS